MEENNLQNVPRLQRIQVPAGIAEAEANIPPVIALALGVPAVGAPEALAVLRDVADRNPAADIGITVFVIGAGTSFVLGTMLLARHVRADGAGGANNPARVRARQRATARFARVTLAVALAVAVCVAACLLAVPSISSARELDGAATSCSA